MSTSCQNRDNEFEKKQFNEYIQEVVSVLETNPDSALIVAQAALEIGIKNNSNWGQMMGNSLVGFVNYGMRKYDLAYFYYSAAFEHYHNMDTVDFHNELSIISHMVIIQDKIGNIELSIGLHRRLIRTYKLYLEQNYELALERGVDDKYRSSLVFLSGKYAQLGDFTSMDSLLSIAELDAKESKDMAALGRVYNRRGLTAKNSGKYRLAVLNFNAILALEGVSQQTQAIAYHNLGGVYLRQGKYQTAELCLREALSLKESIGKERSIFLTCLDLGELFFKREQYVQSLGWFDRALSVFEKPDTPNLFLVYDWAYKAHIKLGNHVAAESFMRLYENAVREYDELTEVVDYERQAAEVRRYMEEEKANETRKKNMEYAIYLVLIVAFLLVSTFLVIKKRKQKKLYQQLGDILLDDQPSKD